MQFIHILDSFYTLKLLHIHLLSSIHYKRRFLAHFTLILSAKTSILLCSVLKSVWFRHVLDAASNHIKWRRNTASCLWCNKGKPLWMKQAKDEFKKIHGSSNPAKMRRRLDAKIDLLMKAYKKKRNSQIVDKNKKLAPATVSKYMIDEKNCSVLAK